MHRPPPIESRRAGLRGGKPEEQAHSSPDENRPSNEQSGALEAEGDRLESGSNAEPEQQAGADMASRSHTLENDRSEESDVYDDVDEQAHHSIHVQPGYHTGWGHTVNAGAAYQRSFPVGLEPTNTLPHTASNGIHHSYFT